MKGVRITALKFGIFAVVALLLGVMLVNTMRNGVDGQTTTYHAMFSDVQGLRVGDDVKVAGVRIGRVSKIEVDGNDAKVDLQLQKSQPLFDNSHLVMRYQNLVGQRYIAVEQPTKGGQIVTGNQLAKGATIPDTDTSPGFDLTELLNGFRPLFQVLQPEDVNTLASSLVSVLQGEGGTVDSLLRQTASLTTFLANRDQVIGSVLDNLTPVLTNFAEHGDDLHASVVALKDLMTGLAKDRKVIGSSISTLSAMIVSTNSLLADVANPLVYAVQQLRAASAMLNGDKAGLVKALSAFGSAFATLGRGTSYENALNIYVCSLAVSVQGAPAINPAGSDPKRSKVCQ